MKKEKINFIISVEFWMSAYKQYQHETLDFSVTLAECSDIEILNMKPVTRQFLDYAPAMFRFWQPKYHTKLRLAIAYLADLYDRQAAAQEREYARFVQHSRMVKTVANAPITDAQKIELVKDYYGWA